MHGKINHHSAISATSFRVFRVLSSFSRAAALVVSIGSTIACAQTAPESYSPRVEPLYVRCASLDGKAEGKRQVDAALLALKSGDGAARREAAEALSRGCDRRAVEPLIALAKSDAELTVRVAAIGALGTLGDQAAIDPLLELIDDPDWRIRVPLSRALCSFEVRRASYDVLNRLVLPASMAVVTEGELYARCQGILMICQLREEVFSRKAVTFALTLLDLQPPEQKKIVETMMRELGRTRNGGYQLLGILNQNLNPHFRLRAAYWIGELGVEMAAEALERVAAEDRDMRVRQTAAEALAKLKKAKTN